MSNDDNICVCVCGHTRYWHRFPVGNFKSECYASVGHGVDCKCPEFKLAPPWANGETHPFAESADDDLCNVCSGLHDDPVHKAVS